MSAVRGKSYDPHFGEPWRLEQPGAGRDWYTLRDRDGQEMARTPGSSERDQTIARRLLDAVNGVVNFQPEQLADLAEKWNRNAGQ
jgi:hypothetical protein